MTEYLFDARIEREPSCEVIVFTLVMDVPEVEELEVRLFSTETAILCAA